MKKIEHIPKIIISTFKKYVKEELFDYDFISTKKEYAACSRCHSRVIGILIEAFRKLDYYTDVERSIRFKEKIDNPNDETTKNKEKRSMMQFTPDITLANGEDEVVGFCEYETIYTREAKLLWKVDYFKNALLNKENKEIKFVVYIPTLPKLDKKPNKKVDKDKSISVEKISDKILKVSKTHQMVYFFYIVLDEKGLTPFIIKGGEILENVESENIWE